jgi:predicted RNA-binding Zn ribbon-like protein
LREELRGEILNYETGAAVRDSTIEKINILMARYPMRTRLKAVENGLVTEAYRDPQEPEDLLGLIAHRIAALFTGIDRSRLRKCSNCVLHFYDSSKKGTRRWCSMQLCGNRAKVATYAARRNA